MLEIYKESGIIPSEFINNIKKQYPNTKICYTARLDPMARGVIPVLFGEECKNMHNYTKLSKTYEVKIILGYKTDSDDALGILENILPDNRISNIKYEEFMSKYKSYFEIENEITINQKYHYFSTKTLAARSKNEKDNNNNNNNNNNYYHNVKLISSKIIESGELDFTEWINECCNVINKVDNTKNFRQKEIIDQWQSLILNDSNKKIEKKINYIKLKLHVGSGFFVRQFIRDISDIIDIPLMCYDIHRISIDYI